VAILLAGAVTKRLEYHKPRNFRIAPASPQARHSNIFKRTRLCSSMTKGRSITFGASFRLGSGVAGWLKVHAAQIVMVSISG
jgi:hypothetical protein